MDLKQWVKSKKKTLLGGAIGVIICALLFVFYIYVYFPTFQTGDNDTEPSWLLVTPLVTGHAFPLLSHFLVEDSSIVKVFCKATNPNCVNWAAGNVPGCKIPQSEIDPETGEKVAGCCMTQIMTPDESCREKVEVAGFIVLTVLLTVVYFAIGSIIAWQIQKRK
jgi:hypothetical protein